MNGLQRTFSTIIPIILLAAAFVSNNAFAQDECSFSFGPPLRINMVFAYRYTEIVTSVHEYTPAGGETVIDTLHRKLTYFISERQIPSRQGEGIWEIEAFIDSMRLEYQGPGDKLNYDTQKLIYQPDFDASHRAWLVPSALCTRMITFKISPYGEVMDVKGDVLGIAEQVMHPGIDEFTRARAEQLLDAKSLQSIYFPWRSVLPLGRTVKCGAVNLVPSAAMLDRVPFGDSARAVVGVENGKYFLGFEGQLTRPRVDTYTINTLRDPLKISRANGVISGRLSLDPDGVVQSGWVAARGEITSMVDDMVVRSNISHEVHIERENVVTFILER